MLLHQIISTLEDPTKAILTESLYPYRRSLLTYYKNYFTSEPLLMVVSVSNACQYAQIVPVDEFEDAIRAYEVHSEDIDDAIELISYQSITLNQFAS